MKLCVAIGQLTISPRLLNELYYVWSVLSRVGITRLRIVINTSCSKNFLDPILSAVDTLVACGVRQIFIPRLELANNS